VIGNRKRSSDPCVSEGHSRANLHGNQRTSWRWSPQRRSPQPYTAKDEDDGRGTRHKAPEERKGRSGYTNPENPPQGNAGGQTGGEVKGNATVAEMSGGNKSERTEKQGTHETTETRNIGTLWRTPAQEYRTSRAKPDSTGWTIDQDRSSHSP
jgi:hypothetical protein